MNGKQALEKRCLFYGALLLTFLAFLGCVSPGGERATTEALSHCVEHDQLNVHAHIEFYPVLNRLPQGLPAGIGLAENCMRPLHTHADDFVVHVESLAEMDFTVRDFLDVWGEDGPYWDLGVDNASVNGQPFCSPASTIPDCGGADPFGIKLEDGTRLVIDFSTD